MMLQKKLTRFYCSKPSILLGSQRSIELGTLLEFSQSDLSNKPESRKFQDLSRRVIEKGAINFEAQEDTDVMISLVKKKVRTLKEKAFIQSAISRIGVFRNQPQMFEEESARNLLFQEIKHEEYKKRDIIFHMGDIGDSYYMLMRGEVFCLIPTSKNEEKDCEEKKVSRKRVNASERKKNMNLPDDEFLERTFPNFKLAKVYKAWECFGDIALITQQNRTATMVCKENCDLICLTKTGFDKIVGELSRLKIDIQVEFLKQFPFFRSISKAKLMSILLEFEIKALPKDYVLFTEGQPITHVFFIFEGEVSISKKVRIDSVDENGEGLGGPLERQMQFQLKQEAENPLNSSFSIKKDKANSRKIELSILGANSYCGIEDLFNKGKVQHTTATCRSSSSTIYVMSKEKFLDNMRVCRQMDRVESACMKKGEVRGKRTQEISAVFSQQMNLSQIQGEPEENRSRSNSNNLSTTQVPRIPLPKEGTSQQPLMNPRDIIKQRMIFHNIIAESPKYSHDFQMFSSMRTSSRCGSASPGARSEYSRGSPRRSDFDSGVLPSFRQTNSIDFDNDCCDGLIMNDDSLRNNTVNTNGCNPSNKSLLNSSRLDTRSQQSPSQQLVRHEAVQSSFEERVDFLESMNIKHLIRKSPIAQSNSILKQIFSGSTPKQNSILSSMQLKNTSISSMSTGSMMHRFNQSLLVSPKESARSIGVGNAFSERANSEDKNSETVAGGIVNQMSNNNTSSNVLFEHQMFARFKYLSEMQKQRQKLQQNSSLNGMLASIDKEEYREYEDHMKQSKYFQSSHLNVSGVGMNSPKKTLPMSNSYRLKQSPIDVVEIGVAKIKNVVDSKKAVTGPSPSRGEDEKQIKNDIGSAGRHSFNLNRRDQLSQQKESSNCSSSLDKFIRKTFSGQLVVGKSQVKKSLKNPLGRRKSLVLKPDEIDLDSKKNKEERVQEFKQEDDGDPFCGFFIKRNSSTKSSAKGSPMMLSSKQEELRMRMGESTKKRNFISTYFNQ